MVSKIDLFIRLPLTTALMLCVSGCTGDTYFISAKNQQRYNSSDIANNIFDDDDDDFRFSRAERNTSSGIASKIASAAYANNGPGRGQYRDSGVIGKLYYDADGEGRGDRPYEITIRKSYRAYHAETALAEPITIGKHKMTPNLSFGHHKDQDFTAGIVFRMPF